MTSLIPSFVNLGILLTILFVKLRQPVRDFVSQRHQSLRHEIQSVRSQLRDAQQKFNELSSKLGAIEFERTSMREQIKREIAESQQKILNDAQRTVTHLLSDAKRSSQALYEDLRTELYREMSLKIVERAEEIIRSRLTEDDRVRMRTEFSRLVEAIS